MFLVALVLSISGVGAAFLTLADAELRPRARVVLGAIALAAVAWVAWTKPRRALVSIGPEGLRIGTTLHARRAMRAGFFIPAQHGAPSRICVQGTPSITIEVTTESEGDALLRTLGLTDGLRASRYAVVGPPALGTSATEAVVLALVASAARVGSDYRSVALSTDELERTLASALSPSIRVGAAVLLRARGKAPIQLRIAAEACAQPHLRAALVAVAEDAPDADLEAALEALEGAERMGHATRVE